MGVAASGGQRAVFLRLARIRALTVSKNLKNSQNFNSAVNQLKWYTIRQVRKTIEHRFPEKITSFVLGHMVIL